MSSKSSVLQHGSVLHFLILNNIPSWDIPRFIYPCVSGGYLGCFHLLATVNGAAKVRFFLSLIPNLQNGVPVLIF